MNDVKIQKEEREWVPFTVMSEQLFKYEKDYWREIKSTKNRFLTNEAKRGFLINY